MDKNTQREIRLQELARSLTKGEMTEEEREEYDTLRNAQSTEENSAMLKIAKEQVKLRLPKFMQRRS
jgi:hypothetical protein